MTNRVSIAQLRSMVDDLNQIEGKKLYQLGEAYGGIRLEKRLNDRTGAINCPLSSGYGTKRELYEAMRAYISGIYAGKREE